VKYLVLEKLLQRFLPAASRRNPSKQCSLCPVCRHLAVAAAGLADRHFGEVGRVPLVPAFLLPSPSMVELFF